MDKNDIVVEIDAVVSRLQQARALLSDTNIVAKRKPGRPASSSLPSNATVVHTMSVEVRAKIASAQKKRWAKARKTAKKATGNVAVVPAVKSPAPHGAVAKTTPAKKAASAKRAGLPKTKTPIAPAP
jgi:hypothetical protein